MSCYMKKEINFDANNGVFTSPTCACCLAQNTSFVRLAKCQHKLFLTKVLKNKINSQTSVICLCCHSLLKKIDDFRILLEQTILLQSHAAREKFRPPVYNISKKVTKTWCTISKIEAYSILPEDDLTSKEVFLPVTPLLTQDDIKVESFIEIEQIKEREELHDNGEGHSWYNKVCEVPIEVDHHANLDIASENELSIQSASKSTPSFTVLATEAKLSLPKDELTVKEEPWPGLPLTQDYIKTESFTETGEIKEAISFDDIDEGTSRGDESSEEDDGPLKLKDVSNSDTEDELAIQSTSKSTPLFTVSATGANLSLLEDELTIKEEPLPGSSLTHDYNKTESFIENGEIKEKIAFDDIDEGPSWDDELSEDLSEDDDDPLKSKNDSDSTTEDKLNYSVKKENTTINYAKYSNTIKKITLTEEELFAERELLKKDPDYSNREYKCEYCIQGFVHSIPYLNHMKRHEESNLSCQICKKSLKSKDVLGMHYKNHFTRFECLICNKRFRRKEICGSHYNRVHGSTHGILLEYQFPCDMCDYVTMCSKTLLLHKQKHKPVIQCELCAKVFSCSKSYNCHKLNIHLDKREYNCKECCKKYKSKYELDQHVKTYHNEQTSNYYCDKCKTTYNSRKGLLRHLKETQNHFNENCVTRKIHLDKREHICKHCSKKYKCKYYLDQHVKTCHNEERRTYNYCDKCNTSYSSRQALLRHLKENKNHLSDKDDAIKTNLFAQEYKCKQCYKKYKSEYYLDQHVKMYHNEERRTHNYCDKCKTAYSSRQALLRHLKENKNHLNEN